MRPYHGLSCSWSSLSDEVCSLSALTWKLSEEHLCSFATPGEHSTTPCRWTRSVARVFDRPCHQWSNYTIHQHTYHGYSPDDKIRCRYNPWLLPPGSTVDAGSSLAAFDTLCVVFGLRTPPSARSATGKRYLLSAREESMNSNCSASDSMRWSPYRSAIVSLADWIKWDVTLSTCARTRY